MITAIGLGTDPTMSHFVEMAAGSAIPVDFIDLLDAVEGRWELRLPPDADSWVDRPGTGRHRLDPGAAFYVRLIDVSAVVPEQAHDWRALIAGLNAWLELAPGTVVNRPGHADDNACKPLHEARLAALGLPVPASLTSCSADRLVQFAGAGSVVAKPLCGQRADCRIVEIGDFDGYDERQGPVHLQELVPGDDVRAHTIGASVVAALIRSDATDYRTDADAEFEPYELPEDLARKLCTAARALGLDFAGWDLRVDGDDHWVLEANPMPGYHYYDRALGGSVTEALVAHLSGASVEART